MDSFIRVPTHEINFGRLSLFINVSERPMVFKGSGDQPGRKMENDFINFSTSAETISFPI